MRRTMAPALLAVLLAAGLTGCVISTQVGERTHVNSAYPDEIAFHFDTSFNKTVLFGRSLLLLLVPLWAFTSRHNGGVGVVPVVLALLALGAAGWLLASGWARVHDYRIEVRNEGLALSVPPQPETEISWNRIERIDGEGVALDVTFGDGKGQALEYATYWEQLRIRLDGGESYYLDLRPLSVEQRGTLWRAIARKAGLEVEEWVEPAG